MSDKTTVEIFTERRKLGVCRECLAPGVAVLVYFVPADSATVPCIIHGVSDVDFIEGDDEELPPVN